MGWGGRQGTQIASDRAAGRIYNNFGASDCCQSRWPAIITLRANVRDRDGKEILAFNQHTQMPSNVRFSPNGRFVVSNTFPIRSNDGEEFVWETETGMIRWSSLPKEKPSNVEPPMQPPMVTFSHDSRFVSLPGVNELQIVSTNRGTRNASVTARLPGVNELQIVSTADWKILFTIGQANFAAFSADSRRLMSYKEKFDGIQRYVRTDAKLWNVETGQIIATLPSEAIPTAKFSSNSRWFFTGTTDGSEVIIWDMLSGTKQSTIRDLIPSGASDFSPDGSRLIQTGKSFSKIWDPVDGKLLLRIEGITNDGQGFIGGPLSGGRTQSVAFSPDGSRIASVAANGVRRGIGRRAVVKVWDAISGQELLELSSQIDSNFKQGLLFSPDGYRLTAETQSIGPNPRREKTWDATPREQPVQP